MSAKPLRQCPFNIACKCDFSLPCYGCEELTEQSKVVAPSASGNIASRAIALLEEYRSLLDYTECTGLYYRERRDKWLERVRLYLEQQQAGA